MFFRHRYEPDLPTQPADTGRVWRMSPLVMLAVFAIIFAWWVWSQSRSPVINRIKGVHAERQRFETMGGARADVTVVAARSGLGAGQLVDAVLGEMQRVWGLYESGRTGGPLDVMETAAASGSVELSAQATSITLLVARTLDVVWSIPSRPTSPTLESSPPPFRMRVDVDARRIRFSGRPLGDDAARLVRAQAMDAAALRLVELGALGALINVDGDIRAFGRRADGSAWRVALAVPHRRTQRLSNAILELKTNIAIARAVASPQSLDRPDSVRSAYVFAGSALAAQAIAERLVNVSSDEALTVTRSIGGAEALVFERLGLARVTNGLPSSLSPSGVAP